MGLYNATYTAGVTLDGVTFNQDIPVSGDGYVKKGKTVNPAKAGTLTTRTSATVGTLTMTDSGHGIATADLIDLYFADGTSRQGVVVGTVSGTSVPITAGAGDNLPTLNSAIIAAIAVSEPFAFDGDDCQAFGLQGENDSIITITQADNTKIFSVRLTEENGYAYAWADGNGVTNPLAGVDAGKVFFTQGVTDDGTKNMQAVALVV